jgi:hypothetical protein
MPDEYLVNFSTRRIRKTIKIPRSPKTSERNPKGHNCNEINDSPWGLNTKARRAAFDYKSPKSTARRCLEGFVKVPTNIRH